MSPTGGGDFEDPKAWGPLQGGGGGVGPAERHVPGDPPGPHARRSEQGGPDTAPPSPRGSSFHGGGDPTPCQHPTQSTQACAPGP